MPATDRSALYCPTCGSTDLVIVNFLEFCWPFTKDEEHDLLVVVATSGTVDWTVVNDDQLRCTACRATFPLPEGYRAIWIPNEDDLHALDQIGSEDNPPGDPDDDIPFGKPDEDEDPNFGEDV